MCLKFALRLFCALICRQSGVVTTLGAIGGDGLYKVYCPLLTYRVSGSKCATITANFCCQSIVAVVHREIDTDGTYFCISHSGL